MTPAPSIQPSAVMGSGTCTLKASSSVKSQVVSGRNVLDNWTVSSSQPTVAARTPQILNSRAPLGGSACAAVSSKVPSSSMRLRSELVSVTRTMPVEVGRTEPALEWK
jgi:hypothetical protein